MKTPTWKQLEKIVNDERCYDYLLRTPEQYRKAMALALARWRRERKEGRRGSGGNGLCAYQSTLDDGKNLNCPDCPLSEAGQWCSSKDSLYAKWKHTAQRPFTPCFYTQREEAADEMYNLLCGLYKREYDRC